MNAPLLASALATVVCIAVYLGYAAGRVPIPGLDRFELDTIDARFHLRGPRSLETHDIVIVGLDDATRARHPEVFQTRAGWAKLIAAISRDHPRAVGIDALFSSPEVPLPAKVVAEVRAAYAALAGQTAPRTPAAEQALGALAAVIQSLRGDQLLASAVAAAGNVRLGILFHLVGEEGGKPAPPGAREPAGVGLARYRESAVVPAPRGRRPPRARAPVTTSLPAIAAGAAGAGFINVSVDEDGVVRRVPGVIARGGRYYLPLGLSVALARVGGGAATSYTTGASHIQFGHRALATDATGDLYLSFLGPGGTFPHISAADILDGKTPPRALAGKLVFVGYTDSARDRDDTPFDPAYPGVELHATLAHNALYDGFLRRTGPLSAMVAIAIVGLLLTALQLRRLRQQRPWLVGVGALAVISAYAIAAELLFAAGDLIIPLAAPVIACVVIALASLSAALATEGREKARLRSTFSQYVSDALVDRLLADPSRAKLGGIRRELTVMFTDIRGFSAFAEELEPEVLSDFLNEYFTPMTDLVMKDGGMLDKYIGDAVMAVYGAPLAMADHARRACGSAVAMLEALGPLNARWEKRGLPEIAIGIGINTGPVSVGNMGSRARFDYTVLGDAVNLASRLEGLTKQYGVRALVGERTAELAGDAFAFREIDLVRVKGRHGTARVFELLGRRGEVGLSDEDLADYAEGLRAYRAREWDGAEAAFGKLLQRRPDDGPALAMRDRTRTLRLIPPPKDWDGAFEQRAK